MKSRILKLLIVPALLFLPFHHCSNNPSGPDGRAYRVLSPAAGAVWTAGSAYDIQWYFFGLTGGDSVMIGLSGDTGRVWVIAASAPNNGRYHWSIPVKIPTGDHYRITVSRTGRDSIYGSSGYFTIMNYADSYEPDDPASLATIIDTGGTIQNHSLTSHDTDWFRFEATAGRTYCIQTYGTTTTFLELYAADTLTLLARNDGGGKGYNAMIIWTCTSGGTCFFKVSGITGNSPFLYSVNVIAGSAILQIVYPTAGLNFTGGNRFTIQWRYSLNSGSFVSLQVFRGDTMAQTIVSGIFNSGSCAWTVPYTLPTSSGYRIKIVSTADTSINSFSDTFTIANTPTLLAIINPAAAAQWNGGTTCTITWTSSGYPGASVNLALYDSIAPVTVIAGNLATSAGRYGWTVPYTLPTSPKYRVRIVSATDTSINNYSNFFTITNIPSVLTITAPAAAAQWNTGTACTISWTSSGHPGSMVNLALYTDDSLVTAIAGNIATGAGRYTWTVPLTLATSSGYRVKISGTGDASIYDFSDSFTITKSPAVLTITAPSSGAVWNTGTPYTVRWTYSGIYGSDFIRLDLCDSTGTASALSNNFLLSLGQFNWMVPLNIPTGTYRIRMTLLSDTAIADESDSFSIINSPASLVVTAPVSSGAWNAGISSTISWTSSGPVGSFVTIDLFSDTVLAQSISTYAANNGSYLWALPASLTVGSRYRIRVASYNFPDVSAYSGYFTILPVPVRITVTAPSAGSVWYTGRSYPVYWSYTGSPGPSVNIDLYDSSVFVQTLSPGVPLAGGSYSVSVPVSLHSGNQYQIRVTSTVNDTIFGQSAAFSITKIATNLTITTPSSSTNWITGGSYYIYWTSAGFPANAHAKLDLCDSAGIVSVITAACSLSLGYRAWTVPATVPTSSGYRIKITYTGDTSVFSFSSNFTVTNVPSIINVTAPAAGTTWNTGSSYYIYWNTSNVPGSYVAISLCDSTAQAMTVASSVSRTANAFYWTLPTVIKGGRYRIKVASTADTTVSGCSGYFTIIPQPNRLTMTTPATGTNWTTGYYYTMYWSHSGPDLSGSYVKLELYDDSSFVQTISSNVYTTNDLFLWLVPSSLLSGSRYRIKITGTVLDTVYDYSDYFTITNPSAPADIYEPDSVYTLARSITKGGAAQSHTLTINDEDWLMFSAVSGTTYTIETQGSLDTWLDLFSTDGQSLLDSDDDSGSSPPNAKIVWTCPATGTYYFCVTLSMLGSTEGSYTVTLR